MHSDLDYFELLEAVQSIDYTGCLRSVRVAVLSDFATQQLVPLLKVLCARSGYRLEVYQAPYDSMETEVLNSSSGLHAFQPDMIVILLASGHLMSQYYRSDRKESFGEAAVLRLVNLWTAAGRHFKATIVQSTYVLPCETLFGNYESKVATSLGSVFSDINYGIVREARRFGNVLICDVDRLAGNIGRAAWSERRLWYLAKSPCALQHLPLLADSIASIIAASAGKFVKCVVLDLDNTLWGGVIGDDGLAGIALGGFDEGEAFVNFQLYLRELKRRGIILAVVSKNDHRNAVLPFREHSEMVLREEDIAVFIANWENKADNIRTVQQVLKIGFDSMVFLDDNPFERNLVRQFLPAVIVPELPEDPAGYVDALAKTHIFETTTHSEADRERADQYREESLREMARTQFADIDEYLSSLGMTIKLERFNPTNLPRIAQLGMRSNQFNLATRRYNETKCEAFMNDVENHVPFTLTLADRFGDYGLISVIVLKLNRDEIEILEYLMSCRVLQRGVERFAMNMIFALAAEYGARLVRGRYLKTPKNQMVAEFFAGFGFHKIHAEADGSTEWTLPVGEYRPQQVFIEPVQIDSPFPAWKTEDAQCTLAV
jgi:FkbH-like protein